MSIDYKGLAVAFAAERQAELEMGKALHRLKTHPKLLWQRSEYFRTKSGGWKKSRSWDAFVRQQLDLCPKEAKWLIQQWMETLAAQTQLEVAQ